MSNLNHLQIKNYHYKQNVHTGCGKSRPVNFFAIVSAVSNRTEFQSKIVTTHLVILVAQCFKYIL